MTEQDARELAAAFTQKAYQLDGGTPLVGTQGQRAAFLAVAAAMDTVINTVPAAWGTKTFKQALIDNLPEPFKSNSTGSEKALVLAYWAMREAGAI